MSTERNWTDALVGRVRRTDLPYSAPFVAVLLFSIPPLLILAADRGWVPLWLVRGAAGAVVLVTGVHTAWMNGWFDEPDGVEATPPVPLEGSSADDDAAGGRIDPSDDGWRLEYDRISDRARFHEELVVRASYFSLATLGIISSVFFTVRNPLYLPFLAEFALAISFAFHIIVEKNVNFRDAYRARQIALEEAADRVELTAGRMRDVVVDHGRYPTTNLREQLVDFNKFWLWAWTFGYHVTVAYVAFVVL